MIDLDKKEKYARRVGALSSDCSVLTASTLDDINQVFYGNSVDSKLSATDLSVRYITADDYHDLIAGTLSDDFEPQTLYVVSSDEINAYNTQVKNVANPVDSKDAANKQWVEDVIVSALNEKASVTDLSYMLMTPGEWDFNGLPSDATNITFVWVSSQMTWQLEFTISGSVYTMEGTGIDEDSSLNVTCTDENYTVTAVRDSLPGHLYDHAMNTVSALSTTTLTLPASTYSGKVRDLYVNLDIQNSTQTININANDKDNNPITLLNSSRSFTLSQGHHVIHILEVAQDIFIVSELSMLQ